MSDVVPIAAPMIGDMEKTAVERVLRTGMISQGPEVAAFESEFSALVDGRSCVAVNSGTSALHLALLSLGLGPGDEVILPSFTFAATANAVRLTGAAPVFVDIDRDTYGVDPAAAAAAVTGRTAALLPVHLYGQLAPMRALRELADRHGLALVEDAAQAHAASLDGIPAGAWGDASAFSFYSTKNMTTGEGGMVAYAAEGPARTARLLRNQGMERQYENEIIGMNLRMTDSAAAIGRVQLQRLPAFTKVRQHNAARLTTAIASNGSVTAPIVADGAIHVYHQYTVRSLRRDALADHLGTWGIEARVYYPTPVHLLPAFATKDHLPETMRACKEVLSLPVGPHLRTDDVDRVAEALIAFHS